MRSDIVPGGTFPDYALPDHTGAVRRLSELQGSDPLIVTLARGHYCPKEHQQHLELAANYPKIAVAYTQVVTISTDEHHTLQEFRASVGAQWTFLSDPGRTIQKDLDIAEYTDPEHDPMIPHTLVLKPGLVIHSVYNGYWFWGRPSFDDLWRDLRAATSQIRPDWDLSAAGLREAWASGDHSLFHGWDRRHSALRTPSPVTTQGCKPMAPAGAPGEKRLPAFALRQLPDPQRRSGKARCGHQVLAPASVRG
jgi:peroxiredoxin